MDVLCDTSFLLILVTKPIKLMDNLGRELGRLNFVLPDVIVDELIEIERKSTITKAKAAGLALEITKKFPIVQTSRLQHTDDNILEYAYTHKCAVATLDKKLIKNLIAENIIVVSLRNNKMVILNNLHNRQT